MSESGLLLNIATSDTLNAVVRGSRKRLRSVNNGDADDTSCTLKHNKVTTEHETSASGSFNGLEPKKREFQEDTSVGLQSFVSKR